jgi:hypothetical protein
MEQSLTRGAAVAALPDTSTLAVRKPLLGSLVMVAKAYRGTRPNPLHDGDAALREAAARLAEARDAFRRAGRADLSGQVAAAIVAVRETELLRLVGQAGQAAHNPADWFLD